jgi:hypothetical protein
MIADQYPGESPESLLPELEKVFPSHAIAAEDRPALEHFLLSCLPTGIAGPKRRMGSIA